MSYTTGSISSATPGLDFMTVARVTIDAHPAWEFVEQVVSGNVRSDVFKCLAAQSGLAADFFVVLRRTDDTSNVAVFLAENYNSGTKLIENWAPNIVSGSSTPAADGTTTGTYHVATLAAVGLGSNQALQQNIYVGVNTSGFVYYIQVTNSSIWMVTTVPTTINPYVGTYININPTAVQPDPQLILCGLGTSYASVVRDVPSVAAFAAWSGSGNISAGITLPLYNNSLFPITKDSINGKWTGSPFGVTSYRGNAVSGLRGYISSDRAMYLQMNEFAEAIGDTLTIDGVVYTCANGATWMSQAA